MLRALWLALLSISLSIASPLEQVVFEENARSSPSVLIAGASGYFGGTVLYKLLYEHHFDPYSIHAIVRSPGQAETLLSMGVQPIIADIAKEPKRVAHEIAHRRIHAIINTAVYDDWAQAKPLLEGLAKSAPKGKGHFITTGAVDSYMNETGCRYPEDKSDLDDVYKWERSCNVSYQARDTTHKITKFGAKHHIKISTVFAPMIFGQGLGFAHRISVQIPAVVAAAYKNRVVNYVPPGDRSWSTCHVQDLADLFLLVFKRNAAGYFFAEHGKAQWQDVSAKVAEVLFNREQVDKEEAEPWANLTAAAKDIGYSEDFVALIWAGEGTFHGKHGRAIGWKPRYDGQYLLAHMADEIDIIDAEAKVPK